MDEKRSDYERQILPGNVWLGEARDQRRGYSPPVVSEVLATLHPNERGVNMFPLKILVEPAQETQDRLPGLDPIQNVAPTRWTWNLSKRSLEYLAALGLEAEPDLLYFHTLAVLHSPAFAAEHADALRKDWPRVPLPYWADLESVGGEVAEAASLAITKGAALGRKIAALLDPEKATALPAQTSQGTDLASVARFVWTGDGRLYDASINPTSSANLGLQQEFLGMELQVYDQLT